MSRPEEAAEAAFGWPPGAIWEAAHVGENLTFRVILGSEAWAVKRYRAGVPLEAVSAEAAWWGRLSVPARAAWASGRAWLATRWLEGAHPAGDWRGLGRLLAELHAAAAAVEEGDAWVGWRLREWDRQSLVEAPVERLLRAHFFSRGDRARLEAAARALDLEAAGPKGFVHMDAYPGNVIVTAEGWRLIDFEEAGFGPRGLDFGQARLHLRARGEIDRWAELALGYGEVDPTEAAMGAALRALYTLGKFPERLDVPAIGRDPEGVTRRYLALLEAELAAAA